MAPPGWMNDMQNMEKVIAIYETLGGKNEQQLQDLVTPYRKWVRTDDLLVREAPFSASAKIPHVMFVFKDLLLIGKPTRNANGSAGSAGGGSGGTGGGASDPSRKSMVMNLLSSSSSARSRAISGSDSPQQQTNNGDASIKLAHHLPLAECTFKPLSPPASAPNDVSAGIQLTRVCRVKQHDGKTVLTVTKVEKMELWLSSQEQRDSLLDQLLDDDEDEDEYGENGSSQDDDDGNSSLGDGSVAEEWDGEAVAPSGRRAWARNRPAGRITAPSSQAAYQRLQRANSSDSNLTSTTTADAASASAPLSLLDLEQRYNVDFSQQADSANVEEFSVEFGEGQMGFSLSSGPEVGVVVGKLSPQGFAQLGGCEIGDRLDAINGIQVELDVSWQRAVDMIKACGRPVTLKFVRNVALLAQVQQQQQETPAADTSAAPPNKTRKWASRKQMKTTGESAGLSALQELEKIYGDSTPPIPLRHGESTDGTTQDDDLSSQITPTAASSSAAAAAADSPALAVLQDFAASNDDERACAAVLTEIYLTEREFVLSLRALITEYVVPLRRATKRKRCRDLDTSAIMCEHSALKSKCTKTSSTSGPLLSSDDIKLVFMNLETIVKVNAELLNSIEQGLLLASASASSSSSGLVQLVTIFSSSFDKIKPFFSMYALYCHQYPQAVARLQKLRAEDEDVDSALRDREARSKHTSLRSLLIKPVQRICRYPLLFQELLKRARALPSSTTAAELLAHIQQTAEAADGIAQEVNKAVEVREQQGSIVNVYQELGGELAEDVRVRNELLLPSRRFIRSEEVFFREAPFDKEIEPRRLYVFNDLLIVAQQREVYAGGGGAPSSGRLSLSKRPLSIKKSLSNLFSSSSSTSTGDAAATAAAASVTCPTALYDVTNWIDLTAAADIKPLPKPDDVGYYGFRIKAVKRTTVNEPAVPLAEPNAAAPPPPVPLSAPSTRKTVSWGATPAVAADASAASSGTVRVVTSIKKAEVWMPSKDKLQVLIGNIEDQIVTLDVLQQNAKLGALVFGGRQKQRNWIKKKNSNGEDLLQPVSGAGGRQSTATSLTNPDAGKLDPKEALAQLQKKYSTKNLKPAAAPAAEAAPE